MKLNQFLVRKFANLAPLPVGLALLSVSELHAQKAPSTNAPPRPAPLWPYQKPFGQSSTPATVTPGGTFSRPQTTFQTSPGSFSRPSSTFSHPASPYTPLPPLRPSQLEQPADLSRPYHRTYPNVVVVQGPVVYEPYYIPAEAPAQPVQPSAETVLQPAEAPVVETTPVVIDLPPGAVIRRPKAETPASGAPAPAATASISNAPTQPAKP